MFSHVITRESLDAAERSIPPGRPVFMLNLLRYREQAHYPSAFDATPCTGREAYHDRYSPAFRKLAEGRLSPRIFLGPLLAPIVAPDNETWDVAALNEYADFATFRAIVDTDAYRAIEPHRLAALENFRLLALDRTM